MRQEEWEQNLCLLRLVRRFSHTVVAASEKQEMDASCPAATGFAGSLTDFIFAMQYHPFITQLTKYGLSLLIAPRYCTHFYEDNTVCTRSIYPHSVKLYA